MESGLISIVDDDACVRDALQRLIQSLGYVALTFESADDFLRYGRVAETACLIVDVQMPGMSGLELQDRLLAEGHDTPVIFITALPGKRLRGRALDAGALGFLSKPVRAEDLIECLKVALAGVERRTASPNGVVTFAAASMRDALEDVNAAFTRASGIKVAARYDASSALIEQIEAGVPADIFVSADVDSMDYGVRRGLIRDDTRVNLLGNRLVLIAPKTSTVGNVDIGPGFDLAKLAGDGRIATGDVRAVPVGLYAKAALEKLGAWAAAEPKMSMTAHSRAALTLVARTEAPLGIVYATDAMVEANVKVIGTFPEDSHPPIIYPVAATRISKPDVVRYLSFLGTHIARTTFAAHSFKVLAMS